MSVRLRHILTISSLALGCALSVPPLLAQSTDSAAQSEEVAEKPAEGQIEVAAASPSDPVPENAEKALAALPAPANEIEEAALAALDKHCSRCHQDGKLENRIKPASGFGNVLNLRQLASDPSLVIPGNPDGSELVKQIASGNMPYDIKDGSNFLAPTPNEEEVAAIRNWIASLKLAGAQACGSRQFVSNETVMSTIADDLEKEPDQRVKGMRYISLTHLYNACSGDDPEAEMEVYRQGVIKLLNSLSTNSDPLTLQTVDAEGTIIKFHLDDLKWTEGDWDKIIKAYPYAVKPDKSKYDFVTSRVGTKVPYVRGDWFAFAASRPPLYHDLLKLPKTYGELQTALGVNVEENISKFLVKRAGFQRSLVSQNNRMIERHTASTGYFWTSYDFAGNKGNQSLFEHPLGPKGDNAFKHDGGETIYSLPNGFQAYYLYTAAGDRLDKGPTEIVRDQDRKDFAVTNGISCFGCHDQGMRLAKDDIRAHVVDNRNFPKETRDAVEALYPTHEEMDLILKQDTERFHSAMRRAGLDPSLKLGGVEPINALSNRYEKDVHLQLAAAEFGLKPEDFEAAASDRGGDPKLLLRRLQQAVVPRDNFEALFASLVQKITDDEVLAIEAPAAAETAEASQAADASQAQASSQEASSSEASSSQAASAEAGQAASSEAAATEAAAATEVAKPNQGDAKVEGAADLTLIADKTEYAVGDKPVFIVQSSADCNLTLINVDDKGVGTVLFPNKFQQDTFIKANQAFEFPAPDAPFQFRMKDPGVESVIALCNAKSRTVDLIAHNFDTKAFTNLGDYEKFATRAIAVEAAEQKVEAAKKDETEAAAESKIASRTGVTRAAIKVAVK